MSAKPAYGMQLKVGGTAPGDPFTRVLGLVEVKPPMRVSIDVKDVTEHKIPGDPGHGFKDKMPVPITDTGQVPVTLNRMAADPGQIALLAVKADSFAGVPHYFQVLYPDGTGVQFAAFLTKWEEETGKTEEQKVTTSLDVTGGYTDI